MTAQSTPDFNALLADARTAVAVHIQRIAELEAVVQAQRTELEAMTAAHRMAERRVSTLRAELEEEVKARGEWAQERRALCDVLSADPRTVAGDTLVRAAQRVSSAASEGETRLAIAERMARYLGWAFEQKLIHPNETAELLGQVLREWKAGVADADLI